MIKNILRYIYYNLKYIKKIHLDYPCKIALSSTFEGNNFIGKNTFFSGSIGYASYIGSNCNIVAKIGKFTSIAPRVIINPGKHPYTYPYASTSPLFISNRQKFPNKWVTAPLFDEIALVKDSIHPVIIGNDCWIGDGAFIVGGITIGDGAVVLAHAVVTKDVPPYSIVGGIPAKVIDYRYSEYEISKLLSLKWWDKDIKWIYKHKEYFLNINDLINTLSDENT